jgi:butyrate kinase
MDRNSRQQITADEYAELEQLAQRADQLMLRKAEAAAILKQRGYQFSQSDFSSSDE